MRNIGLYIHIPFCKRKCYYCDFVSYENVDDDDVIFAYFSALENELIYYKENYDIEIDTIYLGGGTPSSISANYILKLLEFICSNFKIKSNCEITIEANPESITHEKLQSYSLAGVNRLSIGIQSLNDVELRAIGRVHDSEVALKILSRVPLYFENFSVDVITGLPYQTFKSFMQTLNTLLEFSPPHVSIYSLKIEEGTFLFERYEEYKSLLPSEDEERRMFWWAKRILSEIGIYHYEISNFAKKGFECKHNLKYWNVEEYIGVGCAAHSFFEGYRYYNTSNINEYAKKIKENGLAVEGKEFISNEESEKEFIILGLRKIEGFSLDEFRERFGVEFERKYNSQIEKLKKYGLIEVNNSRLKLTERGIDLANLVWMEFV
ncbi:oxygen-independent coproporphyrinogen III oxidase [Caldicellulosiruptor kronotskyensis 2002]|uniref:Heme chaperone HemW n=1 Tax=Caldicellulosiruptor kronotskyensis (strain DSM 18902 / VKM B-2412 / 2002) TaxID=632348 RepID=E4SD05_CALK2|nr:radical SAM family heme chaperone HemW [Caldicellulosiruptor kronotskyensis]ADQ46021.1 oxygen-independent coproporphyrinogen III oxidase [Caldicellulosiruptor kronotskyensis 2002]